jgi:hypothetical protein
VDDVELPGVRVELHRLDVTGEFGHGRGDDALGRK